MAPPPALLAVDVGDPPELWSELGFAVDGTGRCRVDGVAFRLGWAGPPGADGITGWVVDGAPALDGIRTGDPEPPVPRAAAGCVGLGPGHPNGAVALDHVVVTTPHLDRTVASFEAAGVGLRRVRDAGPGITQAFFRLGPVIVEVVGHRSGERTGPAALWGLTFTVADLDATADLLGDRLRPIKAAVQPGRRIATLDRSAGSTVPMAFMSGPAHPPGERDRRSVR